jgi:ATP/maltotriose-dependent transcriptional regulator MalT
MTPILLTAKFHLPRPVRPLVARPHLLAQLENGLREQRKLTLISAPAGYGKSVITAEWLFGKTHGQRVEDEIRPQWLSLDASDDKAERFFSYFLAALRQGDKTFCADLVAVLDSGQFPPIDVLVMTLVNEMLAWKNCHVCVLDDFHHIQDSRHPRCADCSPDPPAAEFPPRAGHARRPAPAAGAFARARSVDRNARR